MAGQPVHVLIQLGAREIGGFTLLFAGSVFFFGGWVTHNVSGDKQWTWSLANQSIFLEIYSQYVHTSAHSTVKLYTYIYPRRQSIRIHAIFICRIWPSCPSPRRRTFVRVYPQSVRCVTRLCPERSIQLPFRGDTKSVTEWDYQNQNYRFSSRNVKNVGGIGFFKMKNSSLVDGSMGLGVRQTQIGGRSAGGVCWMRWRCGQDGRNWVVLSVFVVSM